MTRLGVRQTVSSRNRLTSLKSLARSNRSTQPACLGSYLPRPATHSARPCGPRFSIFQIGMEKVRVSLQNIETKIQIVSF